MTRVITQYTINPTRSSLNGFGMLNRGSVYIFKIANHNIGAEHFGENVSLVSHPISSIVLVSRHNEINNLKKNYINKN